MTLMSIVLRNLSRRKGRVALIVVGLALGVGTVVALRSLTAAIEQEIGAQLDQYGANIVVVPRSASQDISYGGVSISAATFDLHPLRDTAISAIKSIPLADRISAVAPQLLGRVNAEGKNQILAGVDFERQLEMKSWWKISGRLPAKKDELLLGYGAAHKMGVIDTPPDALYHSASHEHGVTRKREIKLLRSELTLGGQSFRIAGLLSETGSQDDELIYAQLSTAQLLLGKPEELSLIEVSAMCNGCPIDDIVGQISAALPDAKVSAVQQAVQARLQTVQRLSRFSTAISWVMLLLGFLIVFVTMMASVVERTKEIGVFRALGFRKTHVIRIFVVEAAIVSFVGGFVGWAAGTLSGLISARHFTETGVAANPSLAAAVGVLGAAVATGIISSVYPAVKAARLDPTESLRYF